MANFLRQPHFIVWDNSDLTTHEVMGGLKNVYAIGAGDLFACLNDCLARHFKQGMLGGTSTCLEISRDLSRTLENIYLAQNLSQY